MSSVLRALAALLCAALLAPPVAAHEVKLETREQAATVVSLRYADGEPFAFEAYELYLPGKETPEQVGRTNAAGELVFLSGQHAEWRLKAFSADGHGVDQRLQLAVPSVEATTTPAAEPPRVLLLLSGAGVLFGLFGLVQLFLRRKGK
ncbi:ABC transporter permease [Rhodocyclus tenuis]|uniref:Nickel transport protein n=1 Tax=Rhodocyclus tenuis TaxID=1066 RepID=A0A840GF47_RHOTE|nr:ABC transporter permease [Rhodocyclus tenuis]MBB4246849.1 nickel transport protein [Rhodocyclus tenuis]